MDDPVVERAQRRRYIDPAQDAKFVVHGPSCRRSFSYQHTRLRQSSLKRRDEVNPPAGVLAGRPMIGDVATALVPLGAPVAARTNARGRPDGSDGEVGEAGIRRENRPSDSWEGRRG